MNLEFVHWTPRDEGLPAELRSRKVTNAQLDFSPPSGAHVVEGDLGDFDHWRHWYLLLEYGFRGCRTRLT